MFLPPRSGANEMMKIYIVDLAKAKKQDLLLARGRGGVWVSLQTHISVPIFFSSGLVDGTRGLYLSSEAF